MNYGSIGALILLFARLAPRLTSLHTSAQEIMVNAPALTNMLDTQKHCDENSEAPYDVQPRPPIGLARTLEFQAVSFAYQANEPILSDISFSIRANETTAIIGPSGSGKSTIADLIIGLLQPLDGAILIDDVVLEPQDLRAWRESVAYVPQDSFLLHDSIRANLLFGNAQMDDEAIWAALDLAGARRIVEQSAHGLDTVVGDRGIRLSGGERQRIALARAILRRPKLLVLDEATSALDWKNQATIAHSIQSLAGQMTVVTIAHRPSMIAFADAVVAIDHGKIVETGKFSELAANDASHLAALLRSDR